MSSAQGAEPRCSSRSNFDWNNKIKLNSFQIAAAAQQKSRQHQKPKESKSGESSAFSVSVFI